MGTQTSERVKGPCLLFLGCTDDPVTAKTALGITQWCPERVAGQLRFEGNTLDLGVPDMNVPQALAAGVKSLIIGVAPVGGSLDQRWLAVFCRLLSRKNSFKYFFKTIRLRNGECRNEVFYCNCSIHPE